MAPFGCAGINLWRTIMVQRPIVTSTIERQLLRFRHCYYLSFWKWRIPEDARASSRQPFDARKVLTAVGEAVLGSAASGGKSAKLLSGSSKSDTQALDQVPKADAGDSGVHDSLFKNSSWRPWLFAVLSLVIIVWIMRRIRR